MRFWNTLLAVGLAIAVLAACATESKVTSDDLAYIGNPGPVPNLKSMPAQMYGAYTFASPENFCRGTRWIISGSMASLWPQEPVPILVKRGTKISVLERKHIACGDIDDRLSVVSGDLVRYQPASGGDERWVRADDVHTPSEYEAYARSQQHSSAVAQQRAKRARTRPLAPYPVPEAVLKLGFMGALDAHINHGAPSVVYQSSCNPERAQAYVDAARIAFADKQYDRARRLAFSGEATTDTCHKQDHIAKINGDAFLLMAKAELRLGMLTAGKNEADAAAGSYVECSFGDNGYPPDVVEFCIAHRQEAHEIANE